MNTTWTMPSLINTPEAVDLRNWCVENSWLFCGKCGKLGFQKLLPSFQTRAPSPVDPICKCDNGVYQVSQVDDVPLLLGNLISDDICVLWLFDIHCGDYHWVVHGYRQRTGPFRLTWSAVIVEEKIAAIQDQARRGRLENLFHLLMAKGDRSYAKFVVMQSRGVPQPFHYEIFTAAEYEGVECAL